MLNKTRRWMFAALPAAVALVMSAGVANAQVEMTRVTVPFAFEMDGKTFDAGRYEFAGKWGGGFVTMTPSEGAAHAFLARPLGNPSTMSEPKLVFYRVGGIYHLAEVWMSNSTVGRGVPVSKEVQIQAKQGTAARIELALKRK